MGKLLNKTDTEVAKTISQFAFSGKRIDELEASEYTLVNIALDVSSSVYSFKDDLEKAYKEIIASCRKIPTSESILVRASTFSNSVDELHGFVNLEDIDESKIDLKIGGTTALYDACLSSIESVSHYGNNLTSQDYLVNGVVFIVTDGWENCSKVGNREKIKNQISQIKKDEQIESIKTILIGVGEESDVKKDLEDFAQEANLDQFIFINGVTAKSLAKLADFVSRSISSSSQSLGTGGPSTNLSI